MRRLAEPDPRSAAVLVDELDPGFLKGATEREVVCVGQRSLSFNRLSAPDGIYAQSRLPRQVLCAPLQEGASRPDLRSG
jgi:hypothetical protein